MTMRFPLYAKLLLWFFLNLLVLAVAGWLVFGARFRPGLDTLISGPAGDRIEAVADLVASEMRPVAHEKWDSTLQRFQSAYHVSFYMFRNDGTQIAGDPVTLPSEVHARLVEHGPRNQGPPLMQRDAPAPPPPQDNPDVPPPPPAGKNGANPPPLDPPPIKHPKSMIHTSNPGRYWVFVRLAGVRPRPDVMPEPWTLITVSDTINGGGLFFDPMPWLEMAGGAILISALIWLPLVRGITRFIMKMTRATEQIAEGRFDVRVVGTRRDELGALGGAINRMAARLAGFVGGQKRFLGDIAHELCSPIARTQVALSILEQEPTSEQQAAYLADVREEVEHMSNLVNELLSFSKAAIGGKSVTLKTVNLADLVQRMITRENRGMKGIVVEVPADLNVTVDAELLARAVGNVVRNAIRYANLVDAQEDGGHSYTYLPKRHGKELSAGPLVISAEEKGAHVILTIADNGPGISEAAIAQIFDPFYRVDTSRARETGGVGLGLAIVKTCIESCGGTVTARNREPSGLEVIMTLPRAGA